MGSPPSEIDGAACAQAVRICACQNLRSAARAVTRYFDECLHPSGMRSTQFVVLAAIHAEGSPTLPRLARDLVLDRSALTRSLRPLVRMGLVRVDSASSARASRAELTEKGVKLLRASVPLWQEAQERFVERLGSERWEVLLANLPAVRQASEGE